MALRSPIETFRKQEVTNVVLPLVCAVVKHLTLEKGRENARTIVDDPSLVKKFMPEFLQLRASPKMIKYHSKPAC